MTQDELWLAKWQDAIDFLETYHRKPSKFVPEERDIRNSKQPSIGLGLLFQR